MGWKSAANFVVLSPLLLCAKEPSYTRDVQPVLRKYCVGCHQPAMKSSDLDLTTYDRFRTGGKHGPAFAVGSPETSVAIRYITGEMRPQMPLGAPALPAPDIEIIRDWIKAGAPDDSPHEPSTNRPVVYRQPPVITALRFSPDGTLLAVGGNREILLHKADGSALVSRLQGKAERILSLAFSADGGLLVAGGGTPARFGEIQFWDLRSAKLLRDAEVGSDTVFGASLSPDGKKVAIGCADNTARVFNTADARELYKISSHENWVLGTVFGVDSKRFVSVGRDRAAKLVDADAGQFLENVNQMRGELAAVARHPGKDVIVIGGEDRIPYVYLMDRPRNMKVGEELTLVRSLEPQDGAIFALDWSPDGKRIAVAGAGSHVNLYNADTGARTGACTGHTAGVYTVAFSPDSSHLAAGGFDGEVRIYSTDDCRLEKAFVPVPITTTTAAAGGNP